MNELSAKTYSGWRRYLPTGIFVALALLSFGVFFEYQDGRVCIYPNAAGCINNLRQIDAAANQFALENHLTNGDHINFPTDLTPYIKLDRNGKIPSCPQGGVYHLSKVGDKPTCSLGTTVTSAHVLP